MQITEPLRFNYEFSRVYKRGISYSGRYIILHIFKRTGRVYRGKILIPHDINRLGVTGSRKLRTAVLRNRVRRLLRESYRLLEPEIKAGYDLIFTMKFVKEAPKFLDVQREMHALLRRADALVVNSSQRNKKIGNENHGSSKNIVRKKKDT